MRRVTQNRGGDLEGDGCVCIAYTLNISLLMGERETFFIYFFSLLFFLCMRVCGVVREERGCELG